MSVRSAIWNFFVEKEENSDKATCNTCEHIYSCKNGTTSSLINHLKSKLKDQYQRFLDGKNKRPTSSPASNPPRAKQAKLEECFPVNDQVLNANMEEAVVDFLADSGVAFRVVGLDSFKRMMNVANRRVKIKQPKIYSRLVKVGAEQLKKDILGIITAVKGDLDCIAFTTYMWTSVAGTPFMSLTVHFIDRDFVLHRFTPYVAPFPARHTGKNISIGLDAMIEELGLDNGQWELFAVSDNAANVKLGIRLSEHLKQYFCSIHTLELGVKDTFKNVPGMKAVVKKTKAIGKYTHKSTEANKALKREAKKENINFRKIVNPPNTRWSGYHDNLASVLYLKKPLMNLMASQDDWSEYELSAGDWKLIAGAVELLKSVRDTIKAWEVEKEPSMHRVVERIYTMHSVIDQFVDNTNNNMFGIGFARELKKNIEKRFPNTGTDDKLRRFANYLAPQYKGIHLEATKTLDSTKVEIKDDVNSHADHHPEPEHEAAQVEVVPLSPTSRLRKKLMDRQQRTEIEGFHADRISPIEKEIMRYESFSLPDKHVDILQWWRTHEKVLPLPVKTGEKRF